MSNCLKSSLGYLIASHPSTSCQLLRPKRLGDLDSSLSPSPVTSRGTPWSKPPSYPTWVIATAFLTDCAPSTWALSSVIQPNHGESLENTKHNSHHASPLPRAMQRLPFCSEDKPKSVMLEALHDHTPCDHHPPTHLSRDSLPCSLPQPQGLCTSHSTA